MKGPPPPEEFRELLRALVRRYGSNSALGKLIGVSGSRVGRVIDGQYSLNIENCLKLAIATGESPASVLRAAGKQEIGDLIERLYGKSRPTLSASERELLAEWETLTPNAREAMRMLMVDLQQKQKQKKKAS